MSLDAAIPLDHAVLCLDCLLLFDVKRGACPGCASECGWTVIPWGKAGVVLPEIETEKAGVATTPAS